MAGPPKYDLVGGRLCLDFCNTTSERTGERLQDYGDLVGWSWRTGILNAEEATRLLRTAGRTPTEALRVHERALALRLALYRIFAAVAESAAARGADLEVLNAELAGAMSRSQLVPTDSGFTWLWADGGRALDSLLWPVARSAADLLTEGRLDALRRCAGRGCGFLFLDTSRNRTRRWCDMRICGNRAKARRHHARTRAGAA